MKGLIAMLLSLVGSRVLAVSVLALTVIFLGGLAWA